jgi:hypothetical protein
MSLLDLIKRERVARAAPSFPAAIWLRLDHGEDAAARLTAELAAGRIGPQTAVTWIERVIVEPREKDDFAARIAALTKPKSEAA